MPPFVVVPRPLEDDLLFEPPTRPPSSGPSTTEWWFPDPSKADFKVPDLSLPKSISCRGRGGRPHDAENRRSVLPTPKKRPSSPRWMRFKNRRFGMFLSPHVQQAFDLSQEPEKTKDRYGRNRVGQSVLLARRLVEAGCRFITAQVTSTANGIRTGITRIGCEHSGAAAGPMPLGADGGSEAARSAGKHGGPRHG